MKKSVSGGWRGGWSDLICTMHKSAPASASRLVILHFCRSFDLERVRRGEVGREQLQAGHVTPATILQQMLGQARTDPLYPSNISSLSSHPDSVAASRHSHCPKQASWELCLVLQSWRALCLSVSVWLRMLS